MEPSFGPLSGGASAGVPSISPTSVTGMAYPAVAVAQPHLVSPTEMSKDDFKREKLSLPKLLIKAGDATTLTRTINEWLQKTTLALNTWSFSAVQLWRQAVNTARPAHQQWTSLVPSLRALQTGLPSMGNCTSNATFRLGSYYASRTSQSLIARQSFLPCCSEECLHGS